MEIVLETCKKYKAIDGKIFENEWECRQYERQLTLPKIFIIFSHRTYVDGVFSSEETLLKYCKQYDSSIKTLEDAYRQFTIEVYFLDEKVEVEL